MKDEKGVSLVEVVISIAVLGIVAATIVTYFAWSFGVFRYVDEKATAESLARSQLEYIKSQQYQEYTANVTDAPYALISSVPFPYAVSYKTDNVTGTDNATLLQKITVTVFDTRPVPDSEIISLEGYKLNR